MVLQMYFSILGCGWDGGDCCGDNVNTQYCSVCECLDPTENGNSCQLFKNIQNLKYPKSLFQL